jgi:hypothetical protein
MSKHSMIVAMLALAATATGHADAPEAVKSAASAAARGVEKAQDAVVHAAKVAASGVEYGVRKAGAAVNEVAHKVGLPSEPASAPKP